MAVNIILDCLKSQNEHGKLAHAFLLETNNVDECYLDVLEVAKFLNCPFVYEKNCKRNCNICRQIDDGNLPSIIKVESELGTIKKEQILELKKKLLCKPVYSKYNIYIIKFAEKLNASSANTMLKFLEEPEEHIIGFLITENKENVISTIKSRCQIFNVLYENNFNYNDDLLFVNKYFDSFEHEDDFLLFNKNEFLNKYDNREAILDFFKKLFMLIKDDLFTKINLGNDYHIDYLVDKDINYILSLINLVEKTLQKIKYNVNLELLLDSFYFELRRLDE